MAPRLKQTPAQGGDDLRTHVGPRPGLTEAERRDLLVGRNQTRTDYPRTSCYHELFEAQAERTPAAVAAECAGERLTYHELNHRSNHWAHALRRLGVGPDVLVGIYVEPSLDMLVGLLAILKAGGAYVPLDPAYPRDRLAYMLADAALTTVLTQQRRAADLPASVAHVLCLDATPAGNDDPAANPASGVRPEHLAYVIYTSGSTGRPKGVMIPHRGLVNYLVWAVDAYEVAAGTGAIVHSSLSFDLTITGLLAPLLAGRRVSIVATGQDIEALARALRQAENLSLVKITPAHLELLRRQLPSPEAAGRTRAFIIGGEALLGESLKFWQIYAAGTRLVNEYGPTETVVGCCIYVVPPEPLTEGAVPIGRPIANTQLYVLDAGLEPVPAGSVGELYIGGDGVARGYLNLPEATARSFIPNPFPEAGGSGTLYKTGDLVRYRPDGNLEFLGRVDQQVKIRGYRIEIGEIEVVLTAHPRIEAAVVVANDEEAGEKMLVAYIVPRAGLTPSAHEFRAHLKERLPAYMVPARFVLISALPLTPNGKVDRRALPRPDAASFETGVPFAAPGTETERRLAGAWKRLLGSPRVGLDDGFFDLGGHSLLAVRLMAEVKSLFATQLDVLSLYQHPTVRELARVIEQRRSEPVRSKLVRVRSGVGGAPVVMLNTGLEFFGAASRMNRHGSFLVSDVPWAAELLRASAQNDVSAFPSLSEMAAPHARLIREGGVAEPFFLAGYSYGGPLAFEVAHQLAATGLPPAGLFLFDSDMRIAGLRRMRFWLRRQIRKLQRDGVGHFTRAARRRVAWHQPAEPMPAMAPAPDSASHVPVETVPWEIVDRIWRHALRRYRPRALFCRGFLFRAEDCIYGEKQDYDGCLGWSGLFAGGLDVIEVPGDHASMWKGPHAEALQKSWEAVLDAHRRPGAADGAGPRK